LVPGDAVVEAEDPRRRISVPRRRRDRCRDNEPLVLIRLVHRRSVEVLAAPRLRLPVGHDVGHFAWPPRQFDCGTAAPCAAEGGALRWGRLKTPDVPVDRRTVGVCRVERCAA